MLSKLSFVLGKRTKGRYGTLDFQGALSNLPIRAMPEGIPNLYSSPLLSQTTGLAKPEL
jgi:hypothetical protein